MTLVMMLVVTVVGTFAIYKLIMWSRDTGNRLGNAGALAIALVMLFVVGSLAHMPDNPKPKRTQTVVKPEPAKTVETPQPTPEELAERERLAEEKRAAELEQRRQKEEEYAAREAELAAQRIPVDEFNSSFLSAAWIMYCAAVQVYATPDEVDYIFTQLRLPPDGTIFDDIKNSRSVEVNGYIYKKNAGSKSVSFLITAKN